MAHVVVSGEIDAPVEALWQVIANFGEVGWMKGVTKVEVTGEGVGMTRAIYAGGGNPVLEVVEVLDQSSRQLGYTITENNPMPVSDYHATCTAVALDSGRSRLDWACNFEPKGVDEASAKQTLQAMYALLIGWVKEGIEGAS